MSAIKSKKPLRVNGDNKPDTSETLSESYIQYIQSVFAEKVLSGKLEQTKSAAEVEMRRLSEQLDLQRDILQKTNKRIQNILFWLKKEKMTQFIENNFGDVLGTLEKTLSGHVNEIITALKDRNDKLPTKNIKVPQTIDGVVEFHKVMEDILVVLEEIHNRTEKHMETYSQVAKNINSIRNSKERISVCMNQCEKLLPCVNSNLLLKCISTEQKMQTMKLD